MSDLAHQLAAHPAWVWREGMLRRRWAPGFRDHLQREGRVCADGCEVRGCVPDLTDPPTWSYLWADLVAAGAEPRLSENDRGATVVYWPQVRDLDGLLHRRRSCTPPGLSAGEAVARAWLGVVS